MRSAGVAQRGDRNGGPLEPEPLVTGSRWVEWNRWGVGAFSILFIVGCRGEEVGSAASSSMVRDSAGIRIVENVAPDPTSRLGWRVSEEPLLSIGESSGDPAAELFRVEDALRLDDGRILVANGGTSEVRVFDRSGVHLATWGGEGEGPGEFTGLTDLSPWPGDSVMAWDFSQNRLTVFDLSGKVVRTQRLTQGEALGAGRFEGLLPDRSLVTASLLRFDPGESTSGLVRRSREFVRVDRDGVRMNSLGRHQDEEYYVRADVGAILRHPFRRSVHSVVWDRLIVISPSDDYEIRAYEPSGALNLIVRRDHANRAVTQADVDAWVAERLAAADPEARPTMERVMAGLPPVESFPAFSELIVDDAGDLWVREYKRPGDERSVWTVFASDGRMRGLVETPTGLTVYRIGTDFLLGRSVDDLGVERVRLWGLVRSSD